MKVGIALFLSGFFAVSALAAELPKNMQHGYNVSTEFTYKHGKREIHTNRVMIIPDSNKGWVSLITPKDGVALLGRIAKKEKTLLKMEYLVVDTNQEDSVVFTPVMPVRFDEKSDVKIGTTADHEVMISLTAKKATFWNDDNQKVGKASFSGNETQIKVCLAKAYEAQANIRKEKQAYAQDLGELGMESKPWCTGFRLSFVEKGNDKFLIKAEGNSMVWTIDHERNIREVK